MATMAQVLPVRHFRRVCATQKRCGSGRRTGGSARASGLLRIQPRPMPPSHVRELQAGIVSVSQDAEYLKRLSNPRVREEMTQSGHLICRTDL
jgi:hypothetical protein